ncbi:MAG: SMC-Scp complex subunit ScpB [Pirellulales bacterium]|nr:SMC-Scp complex subunit ScpB [Pirellulales bacterium]
MSAARKVNSPDDEADDTPAKPQQFAGGAGREPTPQRRLSADSLARAFENARRAFSGRQRRQQPAEPPRADELAEAQPSASATGLGPAPPDERPPHAADASAIRREPPAHEDPLEPALIAEREGAEASELDVDASAAADSTNLWPAAPGFETAHWDDEELPDELAATEEVTPQGLVEAMLFVGDPSGLPLSSDRMAALLRGVEAAEVDALVEQLNRRYETSGCPYEIITTGGGFRLALRPEFDKLRDRFLGRTRAARLSQAAIEVLAAVAYNQPLTAEQVNQLRGTPSGPILAQLVRRQLLSVERTDTKPRVTTYSTTPRFLALFGLQSLDDLPRSEEVNQR